MSSPTVKSTTPEPRQRPAGPARDRVPLSDGCSKWNPIAHRLCSQISLNWAGKPWHAFETLLGYGRDTATTTGLRITASLSAGVYQTGKRVADAVMKPLHVEHHAVYPSGTIRCARVWMALLQVERLYQIGKPSFLQSLRRGRKVGASSVGSLSTIISAGAFG